MLSGERRGEVAHRVAYFLVNGPFPADKPLGCHACDNPPCCNPTHIFAGSYADNTRDMVQKGRHVKREVLAHRPRGEFHSQSKLTADEVEEIRRRLGAGAVQRRLAEEFGIGTSQMNNIAKGRSWSAPGKHTKASRRFTGLVVLTPEMLAAAREAKIAKFWAKVDRSDAEGCWPWTGRTDRAGTAMTDTVGLIPGSRTSAAPRVAWVLSGRAIPDQSIIRPTCGTKTCCRPDHMECVPKATMANVMLIARGLPPASG